jgi:NAD+ diphosphatase
MPTGFELGLPPHLGYTASTLDRAVSLRTNQAALSEIAADPGYGAYIIAGELIILKRGSGEHHPLFSNGELAAFEKVRETVFLGLADGAGRFGLGLDPAAVEPLKGRADLFISDLRSIAVQGLVAADHLPPLAEAKALLSWHARHRFCATCGAPTELVEGGWRRHCPSCRSEHFPRTDPVVIMLAIAGDRCLLGRQSRFAPGMWSCLAGFVEPGESVEEAVRRETLEEAGIRCGRVAYFASQPWPFPMSLMIGCHVQALSTDIVVDHSELESVRWFERDAAAKLLTNQHPEGLSAPPPVAIAHHIIRAWVEEGSGVLG